MQNTSFEKVRKKNVRVWARGNFDLTILLMTIILVGFGIVMVFSASYYESDRDFSNPLYFAVKQAQWIAIGTILATFLAVFDIQNIKKFVGFFYVLFVILLAVVLVIGVAAKGAQRWLSIFGFQFQPSDFAKVTTILFLANYMAASKERIRTKTGFFVAILIVMIPAGLIAVENASTGIIVAAVGMIMMCMGGAKWLHQFFLGGLGVLGCAGLFMSKGYRMARIQAWLHPEDYMDDASYQTMQSLYAIASGGIFGVGFDNSRQKLGYIPESHNDIIFAIICEELGFVGAFLLVVVFGVLIWRGFVAAFNAPDAFTTYAAIGITSMIGIQVILNIAVATNTIPNTGVALPFISYGGSSIVVMLSSIGILLNISRHFNASDIKE